MKIPFLDRIPGMRSADGTPRSPFVWVKYVLIAIPVIALAWNSYVIIPRGYVGSTSLFGILNPQPVLPGFNLINPLSRVDLLQTFVMPKKVTAKAGSHDLQKVTTAVTVPYNLIDSSAPIFYREYGTIANFEAAILDPAIQESVKAVTANFTATDLVKRRETVRDEIEATIRNLVATAMKSKGAPGTIQIGRATLDNLDFTPKFAAAIEAKVKAGQDAERARNDGAKLIAEAEGESQSIRAKAEAEAYSTMEMAKKEADAIRREAAALRDNPDLIELTAIGRWKGKLPRFSGTMPVPMLSNPASK
ncbi:MAG: prohibitin family protein [Candidatus Melainabacteria bacterium]|nr:prohibitin family protein [Candidatus Melainabacteria bacterium]